MSNDLLVLLLVLTVLLVWGYNAFRRWLTRVPEPQVPVAAAGYKPTGEVVELLLEQGYEVTHGKWKVDITVVVNGESLGSSLYVDYFAKRDGLTYVVKTAKQRKPLDLTVGSAVRERLLPYALLYEETAGVLYVDAASRSIHQIQFELEL